MKLLIAFIAVLILSALAGVAWGALLPGPLGQILSFITGGFIGYFGVSLALGD